MSTQIFDPEVHKFINPTFFDFGNENDVQCLETQSASGAFRNLGTQTMKKTFAKFASSVVSVV